MKRLWVSSMEESAICDGFHNLTLVAKGEYSRAEFMKGIEEMVENLVQTYHSVSEEQKSMFGTAGGSEILGKGSKWSS